MFKFLIKFVLILATVHYCCSLPYKGNNYSYNTGEREEHKDRHNLNNYNFEEEPQYNCRQQHNHNEIQHNSDRQHYPLHVSLYDLWHLNRYNVKALNLPTNPKHNEIYADPDEEEEGTEEMTNDNMESRARTIFDPTKNCKQRNFKGRCIKY